MSDVKFIHYQNDSTYQIQKDDLDEKVVGFVKDSKKIITHGEEYEVVNWGEIRREYHIGYFLLNDESEVSPSEVNDENRSKVVGYILDNSGSYSGKNIIISINASSSTYMWGASSYLYGIDVPGLTNYNGSTEAYKDKNGKNNTQIVVDYCNSQGWNLRTAGPAFNYCKSYSPGFMNGEWYLPSVRELKLFYDNRVKFRSDCSTAGISTNMNSDSSGACSLWSSTSRSDLNSYHLYFNLSDPLLNSGKINGQRVVPFLAIDN